VSDFEPLEEGALARLSDEELVAYVVAARAAGHPETAKLATGMLTWRLLPLVEALVAAKVPRQSCEDVVMNTLESFVRSAFDGKVIRTVRAFMATIAKRRIADFHRRRERHPDQAPLPSEHAGDEEVWGEEESVEDEAGAVALRDAVERVLARRNPVHRKVIHLYGPEPMGCLNLTGDEVVAAMNDLGESVSVANVQQIWRRFKVDLESELGDGEDGEAGDG
jgi:DNA-directed RNA polymerase specialized sigma24 family protein